MRGKGYVSYAIGATTYSTGVHCGRYSEITKLMIATDWKFATMNH